MDRHDVELLVDRLTWFTYRFLFGDRIGLVIFLGALVFFGVTWRTGFFINDNFTIANTLAAVAEGHLSVDTIVYGPESGDTPGMKFYNGERYGRNYGLVFAGLPFLFFWKVVLTFSEPGIAIIAVWSLLVLAFTIQFGTVVGKVDIARIAGSVLAVIGFLVNLVYWSPLDPGLVYLIALKSMASVASGFVGVLLYRLLASMHGRRAGISAGALVVLATPIGFWATIPKRHAVVAMLVLATMLCFFRSREGSTSFRALAYVFVAFAAWVFPAEGAVLFAVLASLDILTAPENSRRTLLFVLLVFMVALLPFLVTNVTISGNPLEPPHFLPDYQVGVSTSGTPGGPAGGTGGENQADESGGWFVKLVVSALETGHSRLALLIAALSRGVIASMDPDRLYHVFLRSGYIESVVQRGGNGTANLSLVESMPLSVLVLAGPVVVARQTMSGLKSVLRTPTGKTDIFAVLFSAAIIFLYLPLLPLHAMITARYLLPVMPLLLYLGFRIPAVRRVIRQENRILIGTFILGGGLLAVGFLVLHIVLEPVLGESFKAHALLNLALGVLLGCWVVFASIQNRFNRTGAVLVGLSAAATTVFIAFANWLYFESIGPFGLPFIEALARVLLLAPVRVI